MLLQSQPCEQVEKDMNFESYPSKKTFCARRNTRNILRLEAILERQLPKKSLKLNQKPLNQQAIIKKTPFPCSHTLKAIQTNYAAPSCSSHQANVSS